jgi:hypothetical protein
MGQSSWEALLFCTVRNVVRHAPVTAQSQGHKFVVLVERTAGDAAKVLCIPGKARHTAHLFGSDTNTLAKIVLYESL